MRTRRNLWIIGAGLAAAAMCMIIAASSQEPVYDGKQLSYWLRHPQTVRAHIGPWYTFSYEFPDVDARAVPFLIKALDRRETTYDKAYQGFWKMTPQSVQRHLPTPVDAKEYRRNATLVLGNMGATARPAIPALIQMLKSDPSGDVRVSAATCLLKIGSGEPEVRAAMTEVATNNASGEVWLIARRYLVPATNQRVSPVNSGGTNLFFLEPKNANTPLLAVPH